jgi:hypothetical protein
VPLRDLLLGALSCVLFRGRSWKHYKAANEVYAEIGATNSRFKKIYDNFPLTTFLPMGSGRFFGSPPAHAARTKPGSRRNPL